MRSRYTVVQYVPNALADERMNLGVIAWDDEGLSARFVDSWQRLRSFGSEDIDYLKHFVNRVREASDGEPRLPGLLGEAALDKNALQRMIGDWSHSIQFSPPRGSLQGRRATLEEVAPLLLPRAIASRHRARTRRTAVSIATRRIAEVVAQKQIAASENIVRTHFPLRGKFDTQPFDVVLAGQRESICGCERTLVRGPREEDAGLGGRLRSLGL